MTNLKSILLACSLALVSSASAFAQAPAAPTLVAPASGASLAQPVTLSWSAVSDPRGPVVSYTWQVGTTSSFTIVPADGFTDQRNGTPIPTFARLSGLANGTYFWHVKATVNVGGATGFADSAWSEVRSLTITGLGPAPGTPTLTTPATGSQFHVREFFDIKWSAVPGAQYYLLEGDDDPNFSAPQTLTVDPMQFGTSFHAGWGNAIPNVYYRVRAVSVDNVRGLPSPTVRVSITNTAPVPPPPTPLSPVNSTTVSLPFTFDWSDTANPQIPGYDIDVDTDPNFAGTFGVLMVLNISRSDYTLVSDLAPGNYFWRVRAQHGDVLGPWSAGKPFTVVAPPATPPGLQLAWIITEPGTTYGGASGQARVTLNGPAPAGGETIRIISDMPNVETPLTAFIPAGATDVMVGPITTPAVHGATVGNVRAAFGPSWQQSSLGMFPLLFSLALNTDAAIGGTSVTGTVTLQRPALAGGFDVTLVSADTSLVRPPAHVTVPEGATAVSFPIATSSVAGATPIVIDSGTAVDGYRAPQTVLTLLPAGAPAAAPSLASVTVASPSVIGGGTTTGTVTLTGPAPAGGALVWLNGSLEGRVVTPGPITIPAGSTSATFTITAPDVNAPHWVMIQASYGSGNSGMHGAVLRIDPDVPATPSLLTLTTDAPAALGGQPMRGLIGLQTPAPAGGATISLSSDNPVVTVPPSVPIAAGNSATTFVASTSAVTSPSGATITASTGAGSKSVFLSVNPDPNAPPPGGGTPPAVDLSLAGVPASVARGRTFTATATVANTGGTSAAGYSVVVSFSPAGSLRLQAPTASTQSVPTVAAGSSASVSWQIRGNTAGNATLTMTLKDSSGATVKQVQQAITITN
ncbi:MAG TPA: hypothetical protein VKD69_07310 [Vicinamibacterales bacterium]|nr:hypothetical protein [Vicinamibacterales bacterium]